MPRTKKNEDLTLVEKSEVQALENSNATESNENFVAEPAPKKRGRKPKSSEVEKPSIDNPAQESKPLAEKPTGAAPVKPVEATPVKSVEKVIDKVAEASNELFRPEPIEQTAETKAPAMDFFKPNPNPQQEGNAFTPNAAAEKGSNPESGNEAPQQEGGQRQEGQNDPNGQRNNWQNNRNNTWKNNKYKQFNKNDRNNRNNNRPQQQEEPEDVVPLPEPDSEAWNKARDCWAKYRKMSMSDLQELAKQKLNQQDDQDNRKIRKQSLGLLLQSMENENNIIYVEGLLEVPQNGGNGYLRNAEFNYQPGPEDVYVSQHVIRKNGLKTGDTVVGLARPPRPGDKFYALRRVDKVNFEEPKSIENRVAFEYLTPVHPYEKIKLEWNKDELTTRIMDMFSPIGKGQRSIILAPPRTGKTILLQNMTRAIAKNHPEVIIMVLLIDERPEEVTEMREIVSGLVEENPALRAEVVASTFDEPPDHHARVATMVLEKAKRLVEQRRDVVVLLDSITRFARANNVVIPHSGKILSGGVDANAMQFPKKFFGAARKIADKFGNVKKDANGNTMISETGEPIREIIQKNGSLTIIGTALIDTGSRMDEVIFEEFKGTGNMELVLDRRLAEKRTWPAIDIFKSGTRKEERLLSLVSRDAIWNFRQANTQIETENGVMNKLIELLNKVELDPLTNKKTRLYDTNDKFINFLKKAKKI